MSGDIFSKTKKLSFDEINIGDVVICSRSGNETLIAHRYIGKQRMFSSEYLIIKGDNIDYWDGIKKDNIYGILEETTKSKVFRFVARDGCVGLV